MAACEVTSTLGAHPQLCTECLSELLADDGQMREVVRYRWLRLWRGDAFYCVSSPSREPCTGIEVPLDILERCRSAAELTWLYRLIEAAGEHGRDATRETLRALVLAALPVAPPSDAGAPPLSGSEPEGAQDTPSPA